MIQIDHIFKLICVPCLHIEIYLLACLINYFTKSPHFEQYVNCLLSIAFCCCCCFVLCLIAFVWCMQSRHRRAQRRHIRLVHGHLSGRSLCRRLHSHARRLEEDHRGESRRLRGVRRASGHSLRSHAREQHQGFPAHQQRLRVHRRKWCDEFVHYILYFKDIIRWMFALLLLFFVVGCVENHEFLAQEREDRSPLALLFRLHSGRRMQAALLRRGHQSQGDRYRTCTLIILTEFRHYFSLHLCPMYSRRTRALRSLAAMPVRCARTWSTRGAAATSSPSSSARAAKTCCTWETTSSATSSSRRRSERGARSWSYPSCHRSSSCGTRSATSSPRSSDSTRSFPKSSC